MRTMDLIEAYTEAANAHEWGRSVELMTEDVTYEDVARGERHQGKQNVRAFFDREATQWSSDHHNEVIRTFATDTDYAVEFLHTGTHDIDHPLLRATGKRFAIRGVSIGRVQNGLIKEHKDYWNMLEFLTQVGLLPQAGERAELRSGGAGASSQDPG